ncbi:TetR/AcrR family transcriptional regulator [Desertihabitans brevis]|uniref:TetR/AcrR family transcriptional regulator n=1 Tax=Desertihabitans brevis TaxID=2268447 RepID=A0A367YZ48_9ACTN|nr:TetR/AcrR family transcriptional regulator [Desertihabitans brevis]RCK71193.1 TetR/AcrR family transcriptional regulator [Desertihabitans brevis]
MAERMSQMLRSDARDNREHVLDAARELFAARGFDVPMREIARRAGVGPATLYRRFATKEELAAEVFGDEMRACHAIIEEGLADPDAWHGFCSVVERLCELHARNRGLTAAFSSTFPRAVDLAADRTRAMRLLGDLVRRAGDTGRLRPDVTVDDIVLVLAANNGIHATAMSVRVNASRRFAALAIRAFEEPESR